MASQPARARLLWALLSLILPVTLGHTPACRSPALPFSAAIHFAMKLSAPCSAALRHPSLSWAAVVHWSALVPKALRSSRRHPIHSFPCPPRSLRPPPVPQTPRTSRQFRVLHARHKSLEQDPPHAYNRLDALTSRLHERVQIGNRVVGSIVLSLTDAASQGAVVDSAQRVVVNMRLL